MGKITYLYSTTYFGNSDIKPLSINYINALVDNSIGVFSDFT